MREMREAMFNMLLLGQRVVAWGREGSGEGPGRGQGGARVGAREGSGRGQGGVQLSPRQVKTY